MKHGKDTKKKVENVLSEQSSKYGTFLFGEITNKIIKIAIKVHKILGPGFVENIYEKALAIEFKQAGIDFLRQAVIKVDYEGNQLGNQRVDFIIENKILLELKAVSELNSIHQAQMISYLKSVDKRVGLLLNFSRPTIEIKRVVN